MKKIVYNEKLNDENCTEIARLASSVGIMPETARLLYFRGYHTEEALKRFIMPGKRNFIDPFLLDGMKETVDRINTAKELGETILVYGDYDADGISAAAILYRTLKEYGVNVLTVVPERKNGYGLNNDIVTAYAEEYFIDLVITVDCGISDYDKVEFIKNELGIDVIVTDHHEIPDVIPDAVIINPKLSKNYPFDALCGAGVALKISYALLGDGADKYIDLAATATIADSVPLVGENRDIVAAGLKAYKSPNLRSPYKHLFAASKIKNPTAQSIAYYVAPKINAAGRINDAASALKLFISDDENEIFELASLLSSYNIERQAECDKLYRLAKEKLKKEGAYRNVIMLYDENWQSGFVGIVAARLVEEYSRPVIMFAGANGVLKGSARSLDDVNIFEVISANKEYLIEYGGHSQAAGLAIEKENFAAFYAACDEYILNNFSPEDFVPKILVDGDYFYEKMPVEFAEELELLEPCGTANRKPFFVTEVNAARAKRIKADSAHISFFSPALEMLYFNGERRLKILNLPIRKKIVFEPNVSVFHNRKFLKGFVKLCMPECNLSSGLDDIVINAIFEKQVLSLKEKNFVCENLSHKEITEKAKNALNRRYGSAFVFGNPENVKKFDFLSEVQVNLFEPLENNLLNTIIIAPSSNINGFENVFYMDNPSTTNVCGKNTYLNTELSGKGLFSDLSADRTVFSDIFLYLKKFSGRKFEKAVDFYDGNIVKYNVRQFILCTHVFIELGIFEIKSGIFIYNSAVRSELKNSVIYSKTEEFLRNDI